MPHNPDNNCPIDTIVRWKKTGEFARIVSHTYQFNGQNFLNYLAEFEDRKGPYCLMHDDVIFECPPKAESQS
jgi:hypothetical protein